MGKYIGESVLRKEDPRLVTGEAKYLEDIQLPGMVHAAVKRSDYAHAKIKKIDTSEAEEMSGVLGIRTLDKNPSNTWAFLMGKPILNLD